MYNQAAKRHIEYSQVNEKENKIDDLESNLSYIDQCVHEFGFAGAWAASRMTNFHQCLLSSWFPSREWLAPPVSFILFSSLVHPSFILGSFSFIWVHSSFVLSSFFFRLEFILLSSWVHSSLIHSNEFAVHECDMSVSLPRAPLVGLSSASVQWTCACAWKIECKAFPIINLEIPLKSPKVTNLPFANKCRDISYIVINMNACDTHELMSLCAYELMSYGATDWSHSNCW